MTPRNDPSQMLRNAGLALGFVAFAVLGAYWLISLAHAQPIFQRPDVKTAHVAPSAIMIAKTGSILPYTDYKQSDKQSGNPTTPAAEPRPLPPTASPVAQSIHETVPALPTTPRTPRIPVMPEVPPPSKGYEYIPPQPRDDKIVYPAPGPGPASYRQ